MSTWSDGTPIEDDPPDDWVEEPTIAERAMRLTQPRPVQDSTAEAMRYLGRAIEKLADALTSAPSAPSVAVVGPPPVQPPASNFRPPTAPRSGPNTTGMGKKVYAICRTQNTTPQEVGIQVLGRDPGVNSQQWTAADLNAVLDAMKAWGWDNR